MSSARPSLDDSNPQTGGTVNIHDGGEGEDEDIDSTRTTPWKGSSALQRLRSARNISIGASALVSNSSSARRLSVQREHTETTNTYIASLISDLQDCLEQLLSTHADSGASASNSIPPPPLLQIEEWAVFIHACTSSNNRVAGYHHIHRLFEITTGADPIQMIAAFFRDTINCSVDNGFSTAQAALVDGAIVVESTTDDCKEYCIQDLRSVPHHHKHFDMILHLFGVTPGQALSDRTLDAFLSAVIMARCLQDTLATSQLAQIVVCLEATIPFRGNGALTTLYSRLEEANAKYALDLSQEELVECVQRAADLSNRSHGNFSTKDATFFLDHTWSLLPEHNTALRLTYLYTVLDFQAAVKSMYDFLGSLEPSNIFVSFGGVPDEHEMVNFQERAARNLDLGLHYVSAELLSVSTVAAFALLSGGDAPMSYFVGDLPCRSRSRGIACVAAASEDGDGDDDNINALQVDEDDMYFTSAPPSLDKCNHQVYDILKSGRNCEVTFDTRNSPLAAYLYACLGDDEMDAIVKSLSFPFDETVSRALLSRLPLESVELIGRKVATVAASRAERIEAILQDLASSSSS